MGVREGERGFWADPFDMGLQEEPIIKRWPVPGVKCSHCGLERVLHVQKTDPPVPTYDGGEAISINSWSECAACGTQQPHSCEACVKPTP